MWLGGFGAEVMIASGKPEVTGHEATSLPDAAGCETVCPPDEPFIRRCIEFVNVGHLGTVARPTRTTLRNPRRPPSFWRAAPHAPQRTAFKPPLKWHSANGAHLRGCPIPLRAPDGRMTRSRANRTPAPTATAHLLKGQLMTPSPQVMSVLCLQVSQSQQPLPHGSVKQRSAFRVSVHTGRMSLSHVYCPGIQEDALRRGL